MDSRVQRRPSDNHTTTWPIECRDRWLRLPEQALKIAPRCSSTVSCLHQADLRKAPAHPSIDGRGFGERGGSRPPTGSAHTALAPGPTGRRRPSSRPGLWLWGGDLSRGQGLPPVLSQKCTPLGCLGGTVG